MILLFHCLYILGVRYLKHRRAKRIKRDMLEANRDIEADVNRHTTTCVDEELNLRFDPPVYKQRYEAVLKVLLDDRWKQHVRKVVDFGCAEFGLFHLIRTLYGLTEVVEVDIDEELLREYLFRLQPRTVDYLKKRPLPLTVKVFAGSVADPDVALNGVDAVIAVELIEHLYPDTLDAFPYNIFCNVHPKLVMVTTPNADFNVFFKDFSGRRHYDHKFEWSREQFQDWACNITTRFPDYAVSFIGIGSAPNCAEDRGHCSQMALFVRQDPEDNHITPSSTIQPCRQTKSVYTVDSECAKKSVSDSCGDCVKEPNFGVCTYYSYSKQIMDFEDSDFGGGYKHIETIEYPFDERDPDEIVMHDVLYKLSVLARFNGNSSYETDRVEIPLNSLIEWQMDGPVLNESETRAILGRAGYRIEECVKNDGEQPVPCVIYEPAMENNSSSPSTEVDVAEFQTNDNYQTEETNNLSDWDALDDDADANLQETVKVQASEFVGSLLSDLELKEGELVYTKLEEESRDKPLETKVKFVMTRTMEAGTSKVDKKRKDPKGDVVTTLQHGATSKVVTISEIGREPVAGTSKKRKKLRKTEEDEVVEDVRELTECIVRNSLNRVEEPPVVIEIPNNAIEVDERMDVEQIVEEVAVVANGDLANNNRDVEGNNCIADEAAAAAAAANENVVLGDNQMRNEDYQNKNEEAAAAVAQNEGIENEGTDDESDDLELSFASREALFDPNSKQDLLEDFEIPPAPVSEASELVIDEGPEENPRGPFDVVLLGVNLNPNEAAPPEPFPMWLLHLLGADVIDTEHNEPHFYCQGDGLGVHPSVVEVDIETSSSESSSNNSNDDAESEHTALETAETVSLPEDNENTAHTAAQATTARTSTESQSSTKQNDSGNDEFFDSKEGEQPSTSKGT